MPSADSVPVSGLRRTAAAACLPLLALVIACGGGDPEESPTPSASEDVSPTPSIPGKILFHNVINERDADVFVINADGSELTNLTSLAGRDFSPVWSPDGTKIAFLSDRSANDGIYVMEATGANAVRVTDYPDGDEMTPVWSPDGGRLVFSTSNDTLGTDECCFAGLYRLDLDDRALRRLAVGASQAAWSPDGQRIAYVTDRDGDLEIYVMNADGSQPTNVTNDPGSDTTPAWSPDGGRIAFSTDRNGSFDVYIMNADGSEPRNLTAEPTEDFFNSSDLGFVVRPWSPDGASLVYTRGLDPRQSEIWVVEVDGPGKHRVAEGPAFFPAWSPDGRWVAFLADGEIEVVSLDGSGRMRLTEGRSFSRGLSGWAPSP
jgi:Tol biopolymer transport system component